MQCLGALIWGFPDPELVAAVNHADKISARMTVKQGVLIIDDNMDLVLRGEIIRVAR